MIGSLPRGICMGMGILSDDELALELENLNPTSNKSGPIVEIMDRPGRKEGDVNVPNSLRKIIGETGVEDRQEALALARMFGVSDSSASAYANGTTSTKTYDEPRKGILAHINRHKERITKKAHSRLNSVLDSLTPEKLEDVKARDLAGIAKDMSVVIKNMEPEIKEGSSNNKPVFIFYKPEIKQESYYPIVKVLE